MDSELRRRLSRHPFLGGPGFSVPSLDGFEILSFEALRDDPRPQIEVSGAFGDGNLVAVPVSTPRKPVQIVGSAGACDCLVVLDEDLTLAPRIHLHKACQTVVLGGGVPSVGHGGVVQVNAFGRDQVLFWGRGSTSNGTVVNLSGDGRSVIVGDDCMMAGGVSMATFDLHALIDMSTGRQTNTAEDVILEPHVWVGQHVTVGKGAIVGLGSVIGARSAISRPAPRFCIAGGTPARVLREQSSWDRHGVLQAGTVERLRALDRATPLVPGVPVAAGLPASDGPAFVS